MEKIDISTLMKQMPESKSLQLLPYLDHIMYLRNRGYLFRQISPVFGMKQSTFRYNLKKATEISKERPDLSTGYKIPSNLIDGIQSGVADQSFVSNTDGFSASDGQQGVGDINHQEEEKCSDTSIQRDHNSDELVGNTPSPETDQDEEEDWAAKVMRTAIPSKYAHRFNLKLKHQ